MDLIDRAAYRAELRSWLGECYKACQDAKNEVEHDHWEGAYTAFVDAKLILNKLPTIEAVPLGPLCEWLAGYTGVGPCFNTGEHCTRTDFPCSIGHKWLDDTCIETDTVKCWGALLKKWMEGWHETIG